MKKIHYTILASLLLLSATGCKKFLDVNKDPNTTKDVQESLLLTPIEFTTTTNITGGYPARTTAYWMQQLALNQEAPQIDSYRITSADVNNTWSYDLYPGIFANLRILIDKGNANGNNYYSGIGKVLLAYNLAVCTDLWGDIPYTEAFQILNNTHPKYDSQESIYNLIQTTLDEGIAKLSGPAGKVKPANDDFIYHGDQTAWIKFAYTLKARYYMRLTKAPGHNAATQAGLALAALDKGMSANADNCTLVYPGGDKGENPWYKATDPGQGGVVLGYSFVDRLNTANDPRVQAIALKGTDGKYTGRVNGSSAATDPKIYATIGTFYGGYVVTDNSNTQGTAAPVFLATYPEALFLKAEATLITSGAGAATPIFQSAIGANMDLLGVSNAAKTAYIATNGILDPVTPLKTLIGEKFVSSFLSLEAYNDWRRTGYPALQLAQNAFLPYIPQRFPYPSQEVTSNPQPQQNTPLSTKVWWASGN